MISLLLIMTLSGLSLYERRFICEDEYIDDENVHVLYTTIISSRGSFSDQDIGMISVYGVKYYFLCDLELLLIVGTKSDISIEIIAMYLDEILTKLKNVFDAKDTEFNEHTILESHSDIDSILYNYVGIWDESMDDAPMVDYDNIDMVDEELIQCIDHNEDIKHIMRSDSASTRDDLLSVRLDNMDSSLQELSMTNHAIHNDVFEKYNTNDTSCHVIAIGTPTDEVGIAAPHPTTNTTSTTTTTNTSTTTSTTTTIPPRQQKKIELRKAPSISERLNILHLSRNNTHKVLPINSSLLDNSDDATAGDDDDDNALIDSPGLIKPTLVPTELEEKLHLLQRRNITSSTLLGSGHSHSFETQNINNNNNNNNNNRSPSGRSSTGESSAKTSTLTMHHPIGLSGDIMKAHRKPAITLIHRLKKLSKDPTDSSNATPTLQPTQDTIDDVVQATGAHLDTSSPPTIEGSDFIQRIHKETDF